MHKKEQETVLIEGFFVFAPVLPSFSNESLAI